LPLVPPAAAPARRRRRSLMLAIWVLMATLPVVSRDMLT
jgi:hypothetical protein